MTESDKERFNKRIFGEVLIYGYLSNDNGISNIGADIKITELHLYDRISQYVLQHGEDLQGMFKDEKYEYMSFFIRDVAGFKDEFENEAFLKPLFSHGKGETAEFLISFPEKDIYGEAEEKALEQLKQRLIALGLKWMNKEQSQDELERLLSEIECREFTIDKLETAQWHYMDVVGITSSGLFNEEQLETERLENPHIIKKEDGLTVFEDEQCILFMSKKHGIPLRLCAAYVLSDAWR